MDIEGQKECKGIQKHMRRSKKIHKKTKEWTKTKKTKCEQKKLRRQDKDAQRYKKEIQGDKRTKSDKRMHEMAQKTKGDKEVNGTISTKTNRVEGFEDCLTYFNDKNLITLNISKGMTMTKIKKSQL